jgi:hypothetical protein
VDPEMTIAESIEQLQRMHRLALVSFPSLVQIANIMLSQIGWWARI